ncbi:hypothetical protein RHS01_02255 [Rhizoctonia solani]|uniref:Uncharacterized protein n=1 Tax=Rhizoctonia solani TaxID=456999 RepID=A0A8H7INB0_9AGAM|nr:hypothetical protein RHS01_02255 [Rhizoctonia solani]
MVWSKIIQVFSFGTQWGENTIRLVEGDNALEMVKRVEGILEDSMRVLESHERLMSSGEFNTFSIKHRHLVLKLLKSSIKYTVIKNKASALVLLLRGGPIVLAVMSPFSSDRQRSITRTFCRRAQDYEEEAFMKRHLEGTLQTTEPKVANWYIAPYATRKWLILYKPSLSFLFLASQHASDDDTSVDREPYLAVAHVRPTRPETMGSDEPVDESYRQILILESKDKTVIMINPNRCYPNDQADSLNEESLLEMSRAGEVLLQATDPNHIQGYEVVGRQSEASWVDSFIDSLSRLGVGIGANMM